MTLKSSKWSRERPVVIYHLNHLFIQQFLIQELFEDLCFVLSFKSCPQCLVLVLERPKSLKYFAYVFWTIVYFNPACILWGFELQRKLETAAQFLMSDSLTYNAMYQNYEGTCFPFSLFLFLFIATIDWQNSAGILWIISVKWFSPATG